MFLLKYARGFFKRKIIVIVTAIFFVLLVLYSAGFLGGEDNRVRIACVGDSLTYGSGVLKTREINSYPSQLQVKLGTSYYVMNFGLRNATASVNGNLPYEDSVEYAASLESNPDVVILMLGTNDSKTINWDADAYKAGLTEMVNAYKALDTNPKIYLMRSPYCFEVESDSDKVAEYYIQPNVVRNEIGQIVQEVADETGAEFIDLYASTEGKQELYTKDGIHFNKNGYSLIASVVYNSIK